jgi:putative NADH-flavin reductase
MNILVFGATGYVGTAIETELLNRGHSVTGVARSFEGKSLPEGVTPVVGSLFDYSLADSDFDAIVVALPSHGADGHDVGDAIPALLAAGRRFGVVGGAGSLIAEDGRRVVDQPGFPDEYKPESLASAAALESLRASDSTTDWFFVSPAEEFGSYNAGTRTGSYRLGEDSLVKDSDGKSFISGADYAIAFVDELEKPAHHQQRFTVGY